MICKIHLGFDGGFFFHMPRGNYMTCACKWCMASNSIVKKKYFYQPMSWSSIYWPNYKQMLRFSFSILIQYIMPEYLLYGFIVTIQWCFYKSFFLLFLLYSNGHSLPFDYTIYWRFRRVAFFSILTLFFERIFAMNFYCFLVRIR